MEFVKFILNQKTANPFASHICFSICKYNYSIWPDDNQILNWIIKIVHTYFAFLQLLIQLRN